MYDKMSCTIYVFFIKEIEKNKEEKKMAQQVNIQDHYLNQLRKEHIVVTVFLTNGFQLRGVLKGFDNFTILLETEGKQQLIYKHAISTFSPSKNVDLEPKEGK